MGERDMAAEALADVDRLHKGIAGLRLAIASNQGAIEAWGSDPRRKVVRAQAEARITKAQRELAVLVAEAEEIMSCHA